MLRSWLWTVGLSPAALGCSDPGTCTTDVVPGVVVEIRDAADDTPLAAGARGAVHDGAFTDSLRPHSGVGDQMVSRAAADERAGRYTVRLEHAGYADWVADGIRVEEDDCHVRTAELIARLERLP
jgi:hypothetical protein